MFQISAEMFDQALRIALFGMLGIFGVLTAIMLSVLLLNRLSAGKRGGKTEQE